MVDVYKKLVPNKKNKHYASMSFVIMFLLSLTGLLIAYLGNNLYELIQILFSVSAGVAPVFILRWVWLRINAWSQLAAMSFSILYIAIFDFMPLSALQDYLRLNVYSMRILFVTFCTTISWLTITYLTPRDDEKKLSEFRKTIPLSSFSSSKIILAFGVGILFTSTLALFVYFLISWW
jgi:hypothetical protein